MIIDPDVLAFEARRTAARVPADAVLKRSKVSASTLHNLVKKGGDPKASTLRKLNDALDAEIAARGPQDTVS